MHTINFSEGHLQLIMLLDPKSAAKYFYKSRRKRYRDLWNRLIPYDGQRHFSLNHSLTTPSDYLSVLLPALCFDLIWWLSANYEPYYLQHFLNRHLNLPCKFRFCIFRGFLLPNFFSPCIPLESSAYKFCLVCRIFSFSSFSLENSSASSEYWEWRSVTRGEYSVFVVRTNQQLFHSIPVNFEIYLFF